jgi:hypothetical protein
LYMGLPIVIQQYFFLINTLFISTYAACISRKNLSGVSALLR